MKKILILICSVLLITALTTSVLASNTHDIPELKLSVEAPDGWLILTQNPEDNVEAAQLMGSDEDFLADYLKERAIYLDFLKADFSEEIFINMVQDDSSQKMISLNALSENQLKKVAESLMGMSIEDLKEAAEEISFEGIDAQGVEWLGYEIYNHEQAVFLKLYNNKTVNGITLPSVQYSTIQNGQSINVSIMSYTGELTDSLESLGQDVVDSIVFTEIQKGNAPLDIHTVIKSALIFGCICAIALLIVFLIIGKNKKNTPPDLPTDNISSDTHSGTLE